MSRLTQKHIMDVLREQLHRKLSEILVLAAYIHHLQFQLRQ